MPPIDIIIANKSGYATGITRNGLIEELKVLSAAMDKAARQMEAISNSEIKEKYKKFTNTLGDLLESGELKLIPPENDETAEEIVKNYNGEEEKFLTYLDKSIGAGRNFVDSCCKQKINIDTLIEEMQEDTFSKQPIDDILKKYGIRLESIGRGTTFATNQFNARTREGSASDTMKFLAFCKAESPEIFNKISELVKQFGQELEWSEETSQLTTKNIAIDPLLAASDRFSGYQKSCAAKNQHTV